MRLFMSSTIKYTPFKKKYKEQNSGLPHFLEKFFLLPSKTSGQRTAGAARLYENSRFPVFIFYQNGVYYHNQ